MTTAKEDNNTCAGKPIFGAMHIFSADLLRGCERFSALARGTDNAEEIRVYNAACIMCAVASIEAKVNEWVSIAQATEFPQATIAFWKALNDLERDLRIQDKWNIIASLCKGTLWNASVEPFDSIGVIVSLRNELPHYKGHFFGKDEAPNKRIKGLMKRLNIESKASFVEDDVSTWVSDLLSNRELAPWVFRKVRPFHEQFFDLVGGAS